MEKKDAEKLGIRHMRCDWSLMKTILDASLLLNSTDICFQWKLPIKEQVFNFPAKAFQKLMKIEVFPQHENYIFF